jgi:type II secretory pathway component PulF
LLACVAVPAILPFSGSRIGAFLIFAWCVLCAAGVALASSLGSFQAVSPDSFGVIVAVVFWTAMAAGVALGTLALAIGMYQAIAKVMRSGVGVFGSLFRSIPLLDRFARPLAMARFLSALGVLLEARAPLPESLTLAAQTSGLGALWRAAYRARLRLEQGQSLAAALEPEPFIPLRLRRLLDLAEKNGTLPEQCQRLAEWCHEDAEHWAHRLCAVLEPMTSIVMGALVLCILLGVYLPLFRLPVEMMKKQDDYPRIQAQVWKGP